MSPTHAADGCQTTYVVPAFVQEDMSGFDEHAHQRRVHATAGHVRRLDGREGHRFRPNEATERTLLENGRIAATKFLAGFGAKTLGAPNSPLRSRRAGLIMPAREGPIRHGGRSPWASPRSRPTRSRPLRTPRCCGSTASTSGRPFGTTCSRPRSKPTASVSTRSETESWRRCPSGSSRGTPPLS